MKYVNGGDFMTLPSLIINRDDDVKISKKFATKCEKIEAGHELANIGFFIVLSCLISIFVLIITVL